MPYSRSLVLAAFAAILSCAAGPGPEPGPGPNTAMAQEPAGCGGDAGPVDAPEDMAQAVALEPGKHAACFDPNIGSNDVDYFVIRAPSGAYSNLYEVTFDLPPGGEAGFEIYNGSGERLQMLSSEGPARLWLHLQGGTQMRLRAHSTNEMGPYSITLSRPRSLQDAEPNQELETATPIELGKPQKGHLARIVNGPDIELDVYRLDVKQKTKVSVELTDVPSEAKVAVEIMDAGGNKIAKLNPASRGANVSGEVTLKPGKYTFAVGSWGDRAGHLKVGKGELPSGYQRPYILTLTGK